jgi:hypothetical protein
MQLLNQRFLNSIVKWLLLCGWFALFIGGVIHWSGSWLAYTIFSLVFLAMLVSGFYRQISYGYLFLVVMLWLGFWLKLTVHLLVDYPFGEPIGFFVGTPSAWDEVLWISTIGSMGVGVARLLYGLAGQPPSMLSQNVFKVPAWYPATRRWIWGGAVFACVGLAIINASLGIQQSGLVSNVILLWPFNAIVYWLLASGLSFGIATLLWWDMSLKRNISFVVYFALLEAYTSTISLLSRVIYIFHVVPLFLALYKNRNVVQGWSRKNTIVVSLTFIVLLATSNPLVNTLRSYYYFDVIPALAFEEPGLATGLATGLAGLAKFAVDRWIGVEGVMAVSAYPNKEVGLFVRALAERGEIGKSTIYQEICKSHYRFMDMNKFQFASLPGATGFLYFTGYLWVVALGMVVLVLAVLTSNPLLSALWGVTAASSVAQMGIAPRGLLIYFFEMSCGIATIWFIQSELFSKMLQKYRVLSSVKSV